MNKKKMIRNTVIVLCWIALWQFLSLWIKNKIFFAGPLDTLEELFHMLGTAVFYKSVLGTLGRILIGFFSATLCGFCLSFFANRFPLAKSVLAPFVALLKSVPVAAIVVLLLIWYGSENLAIFIAFMVVFPNVYINMLEGLENVSLQMLEMAQVFHLSAGRCYRYILRPEFLPYLRSALKISLGMSFKSGIAAEIIGLTANSIGERLYSDKIYLNTPGVFAWIVVILLLSSLLEYLVLSLFNRIEKKRDDIPGKGFPAPCSIWEKEKAASLQHNIKANNGITITDLFKKYYEQELFHGYSLRMERGKIYRFSGPSGTGKTTLFRILSGLELPDKGQIQAEDMTVAMQFQEDRLCDYLSGIDNLRLTLPDLEEHFLREQLENLLEEEWLDRPVKEYSGGMKRRVSFLRAALSDADILLFDEPFTGVDEERRKQMMEMILQCHKDKIVLINTHEEIEDGILADVMITSWN